VIRGLPSAGSRTVRRVRTQRERDQVNGYGIRTGA